MGLSTQVVIWQTKPIHNFGQIVFTDKFYISPVLAKYLLEGKNTYLCRTVWPNCMRFPTDLVKTKAQIRWMPRGASDWWQYEGMLATARKDNRLVNCVTSAHTPDWPPSATSVTTQHWQNDGKVMEFQSPPSVAAYQRVWQTGPKTCGKKNPRRAWNGNGEWKSSWRRWAFTMLM